MLVTFIENRVTANNRAPGCTALSPAADDWRRNMQVCLCR